MSSKLGSIMATPLPFGLLGTKSCYLTTGKFLGNRVRSLVFGRPFVKRFALCYRTVVSPVVSVLSCLSCPVCLSVTLVYCGQTDG